MTAPSVTTITLEIISIVSYYQWIVITFRSVCKKPVAKWRHQIGLRAYLSCVFLLVFHKKKSQFVVKE